MTTEARSHVRGALKFAQLGEDAVHAWIKGSLAGVDLSEIKGFMMVDLWGHVGEIESAFFKIRRQHTTSIFLLAFVDSQADVSRMNSSVHPWAQLLPQGLSQGNYSSSCSL